MSILSRASTFEAAAFAPVDIWRALELCDSGEAKAFELTSSQQQLFVTLSASRKDSVLTRLAAASSLVSIKLENAQLDNGSAALLADILKKPTLQTASFERNNLTEAGLLVLAEALKDVGETGALEELSVAHQRVALSTVATFVKAPLSCCRLLVRLAC